MSHGIISLQLVTNFLYLSLWRSHKRLEMEKMNLVATASFPKDTSGDTDTLASEFTSQLTNPIYFDPTEAEAAAGHAEPTVTLGHPEKKDFD